MFKLSEIKELIKLVDQSSLQELEIENEGARLAIRKPSKSEPIYVTAPAQHTYAPIGQASIANTAPVAALDAALPATGHVKQEDSSLHKIVSPMVGTFYQSASPGSAPFTDVGNKVGDKSVVCIIEAMKLMNEIEAEIKGEIVEILVENGQLVEYGQPLFLVKPE
ncbi:biotin carboxyl carrier protein of acetyl-CoA carboxylase [Paenibacillus marchantiophytorum]|uniref:Biotin carboxyl carrier protein of acetyl-CoA carboxylase n=1 Tax=Paenibacillus marchantiophytorum TaxID=1619310 RepID=A0ABQ1F556_9BACL|nr:acetyl-CoA carboxylase biotin carboxyl carrier protein [Paenibacillus marchantiophytorum]GFZ99001.1 biotin carboxyl carrier protein of acetyl-CoA carboxylase [Paenibacillus marchantiophytorum]